MKKLVLALAVLMSVGSLAGCAREGFEASLNKRGSNDPVKIEAEKDMNEEDSSQSVPSAFENMYVDFRTEERNENNLYIAYSLPVKDGVHDEVCDMITGKIESTLEEITGQFDISKETSYLNIYDSVGAITADIISLFYEGEYYAPGLSAPTKFAFGLNFNAHTGGQYTVSEVMKPHTMATLIMDEQSSRILGKEEEVKKIRNELNTMGMSALADRIVAADSQQGIDNLFAFSFYLEKGNLVAIIPMSDDTAAPAYIELMNDKV